MRDDWVDDMVTELSNGDRNRYIGLLFSGFRSLVAVLEAMKLVSQDKTPYFTALLTAFEDVANHQIRYFRPLLIEDTVHSQ